MNIERVPIDRVVPWDKNPRGIKTKDYDRLKKQITKLGVYKPLIAYRENGNYVVLGGNMRIRALKELGIKEVDVSVVEATTEAKKIEYAMSDNDRAGFYEEDKLAELVYPEIANLDLSAFKVDLGEAIDLKQVVERYGPDIDDGADDVPEVDDTPAVTRMGDLFTLGKHRLLCGDSTKSQDVAWLMRGEKADLCLTDPPYNIGFKSQRYKTGYNTSQDKLGDDEYLSFLSSVFKNAQAHTSRQIVTVGTQNLASWLGMFEASAVAPWIAKNKMSGGKISHLALYEPIVFFGQFDRTSRSTDLFEFSTSFQKEADEHPCPKPLALFTELVKCYATDSVLDPFLGSGTTLIAAEKTGRVCYGMEIDPKYCDVIIKRYADYTGTSEDAIRATRENTNG